MFFLRRISFLTNVIEDREAEIRHNSDIIEMNRKKIDNLNERNSCLQNAVDELEDKITSLKGILD